PRPTAPPRVIYVPDERSGVGAQSMVADTGGTRLWARLAAERRQPRWIAFLGNASLILAAAALGVGLLYIVRLISGPHIPAAAIAVVLVATSTGAGTAVARWVHARMAGRVDLLSQALDASHDAQLILAPDGQVAYSNAVFRELFQDAEVPPLERIAAALADP